MNYGGGGVEGPLEGCPALPCGGVEGTGIETTRGEGFFFFG